MNRVFLVSSFVSAVSAFAVAQSTELHHLTGAPFGNNNFTGDFGETVSTVGDVDGDGLADFAVTMESAFVWPGPAPDTGRVLVYSGVGGAYIRELINTQPSEQFGSSVDGVGDWNADGFAEIAVGSEGLVQVFSGRDGSVLRQFANGSTLTFGSSARSAGDVDGDGIDDLIVGAEEQPPSNQGAAFVYSSDGSLLHLIQGTVNGERLGKAVDTAGDVNNDGHADLLISSETTANGSIHVYSGFDGSFLFAYPREFGTFAISGGDDLNGDQVPDFIVGYFSQVIAVSGVDGSPLHVAPAGLREPVALVGDVDEDGLGDYLGGHAFGGSRLVSGSGVELGALDSGDLSVSGGEDFNGDGRPDLVASKLSFPEGVTTYAWGSLTPATPYCLGDGSGATCPCTDTSLVLRETFAVDGVLPDGWDGAAVVASTCDPGNPCLSAPYLYIGNPTTCDLGFGTVWSAWTPLPDSPQLTLDFCASVRICAENHYVTLIVETESGSEFRHFSNGGVPTTVDLSFLAGETIRVGWKLRHDGLILIPYPHGVWVDNVIIHSSSANGYEGEGCRNSTGHGGILLAHGSTSVAADELELIAAQLPRGQSGIFFVGDTTYTPPFEIGDGMTCTGGNSLRYPSVNTDGGSVRLEQVIGQSLGLISAGNAYGFQFWHRESESFCGELSNLTHGVLIDFTP